MEFDKIFYYSHAIKEYIKLDLHRFGYRFKNLDSTLLEEDHIKNNLNIIWYETQINQIIKNIDQINNGQQKNVLIIDHHFQNHVAIQKLDDLIEADKLKILGTQEIINLYSNIECYHMSSSELWCHHDFIYYMVKKWHKQRQPKEESLFLFMSAKKDTERNETIDKIKNNLGKNMLELPLVTSQYLYEKQDNYNDWIRDKFDGSNMLGGFGNGTPRFDLYDRVFAEIVIETVYNTPTLQVTEKTWRPIACGVPCILLLNPANIKHLRSLGYDLQPKEFYDELVNCSHIEQAVQKLLHLSIRLTQDNVLKDKLRETAIKNYKKFWEVKSFWEAGIEGVRSVFGFCPIDEIEEKLKSI